MCAFKIYVIDIINTEIVEIEISAKQFNKHFDSFTSLQYKKQLSNK